MTVSFWQLINLGGFTVYFLFLLSIISIAIIIERTIFYRACRRRPRTELMAAVNDELRKNAVSKAVDLCEALKTPLANVVLAGLQKKGKAASLIDSAMERQIVIETMRLEKRISIVGTIGSTSVYIGLFGTVLGIIKAFQDIAQKGTGGIGVVINGIAEALICTAVGLCVAVPAVIAYNYFIKRIEDLIKDMELCASETMELLTERS